jgi:3-oxoacyl-[acyl-carrier-protein] synthase II
MSYRRVVVTGMGIISPVGIGLENAWSNITAGRSGITAITRFDATNFPVRIAGEVKGFDVEPYLPLKEARRYDTFVHYALAASVEAIRDAGLENYTEKERAGICIGSGIGGLPYIENTVATYLSGGVRKITPFFVPGSIINMTAGLVSIQLGYQGPNLSTVTACSSANHSIGEASRLIAFGDADIMVAGGAESTVSPLGIGGFCALRALSTSHNDDPENASRPWDTGRDGFVLGEGAGILVLEEYEHAKARGARIYCELAGYGMSADAYHITAPAENGDGARRSMLSAIKNAKLNPDQIDYINAHGTSTPLGDLAECNGVKAAFGDHAKKLAVSSTKSMTGHLLGAAGGIEAVFSILALRDQIAPPTINLTDPDPACDLDFVPNVAREMPINAVMSNSFGFGGTNATLIFKKPD